MNLISKLFNQSGNQIKHTPCNDSVSEKQVKNLAAETVWTKLYTNAQRLRNSDYFNASIRNESSIMAQQALQMAEQTLGPNHLTLVEILMFIANCHSHERAICEPLFKRALAIQEEHREYDQPHFASNLHKYAIYCVGNKEYDLAETVYIRAINMFERNLGPDHPDLIFYLNQLAELYVKQGQCAQLETILYRMINIIGHNPDPACDKTLSFDKTLRFCELNLPRIYIVPLFENMLSTQEKMVGPNDQRLLSCLYALARVSQKEKTVLLYERVLAIEERMETGADHINLVKILDTLAQECRDLTQCTKITLYYKRALEITCKTYGSDNIETAYRMQILVRIYMHTKNYELAEPLVKGALEIFEKTFDKNDGNVVGTISESITCATTIAQFYRQSGKDEEANELEKLLKFWTYWTQPRIKLR